MGGFERKIGGGSLGGIPTKTTATPAAPGKRTLVDQLPPAIHPVQRLIDGPDAGAPVKHVDAGFGDVVDAAATVQRSAGLNGAPQGDAVQRVAARGVAGAGGPLPYRPTIQELFGRHDVSGIEANVGGDAATASRAIGAEAYATGNKVAFASAPSLHSAAHEAAHVVQQRGGVQLKGGVGEVGDAYEQHADAVADAVVQGKSAEALLDQHAGGASSPLGASVQKQAASTDTAVQAGPSAEAAPPTGAETAPAPAETPAPTSMTALAGAEPAAEANGTPAAAATEAPASATAPAATAADAPPGAAPAPSVPVPGIVRVTAPDGLRVRRTPDAKSRENVMGVVAFHAELEAHAREGEWIAVTYRMMTAYVNGSFVEAAPQAEAAASAPAPARDRTPAAQADHTRPGPQMTPQIATSSAPSASHGEPGAAGATPTPTSAPTPQTPAEHDAAPGEFTTLSGNAIAKTTEKEAAVLNALRAVPQRFNPAWLVTAQRALGVVDATGAMNTETLRAMRTRAGKPLNAAGILDKSFLLGIVPGEPFMASELGFAEQAPDGSARRPADLAAQAVGYASYAAYQAEWVAITFLGRSLGNPKAGSSGRGHPYLAARVRVAEAFLRQRHPGLSDEGVIKEIGWNGQGNAAYADQPETKTSHQHTMGLAIDIDPAHNPYVFDEHPTGLTHDQAMWWIQTFEQMFKAATRIYGGEPIDPKTLMDWSQKSSSEELIHRVTATSNAFARYLELSKKPEEEILATLAKAGYSTDEANVELPNVQHALERFQKGGGRQHATALTNIREELLIALRDVAGLSWGGTEMSPLENGDFMHFDCRDTSFGHAVYSKKAPAKHA